MNVSSNIKITYLSSETSPVWLSDTTTAVSMTQRKFSMKKMALKSTFGFTTVNHYYTEEERQVIRDDNPIKFLQL